MHVEKNNLLDLIRNAVPEKNHRPIISTWELSERTHGIASRMQHSMQPTVQREVENELLLLALCGGTDALVRAGKQLSRMISKPHQTRLVSIAETLPVQMEFISESHTIADVLRISFANESNRRNRR